MDAQNKLGATTPPSTLTLEVKSSSQAQVQIINSAGLVYVFPTGITPGAWVASSTLPTAGLVNMVADPDPKKVGWYLITLTIDKTIPDDAYRAFFYVVDPTPELLCESAFGVTGGFPYTEGVLPPSALPPSPTAIAIKLFQSTVALHATPAGSFGALMNELQAVIIRLNAYLTKLGG